MSRRGRLVMKLSPAVHMSPDSVIVRRKPSNSRFSLPSRRCSCVFGSAVSRLTVVVGMAVERMQSSIVAATLFCSASKPTTKPATT